MKDFLLIILTLAIAFFGWAGSPDFGTPISALTLIVLIWKCYSDSQTKKEMNEKLQELTNKLEKSDGDNA